MVSYLSTALYAHVHYAVYALHTGLSGANNRPMGIYRGNR